VRPVGESKLAPAGLGAMKRESIRIAHVLAHRALAEASLSSGGDAIIMSGDSRLWHHGLRSVMSAIWSPLPRAVREAFLLRKAFR
jgi:hypothetical protein